jgi:hypothetical protein
MEGWESVGLRGSHGLGELSRQEVDRQFTVLMRCCPAREGSSWAAHGQLMGIYIYIYIYMPLPCLLLEPVKIVS